MRAPLGVDQVLGGSKGAETWMGCYKVPTVSPSLVSKVKEHHTILGMFGVLRTVQKGWSCPLGLIHTWTKETGGLGSTEGSGRT